MRADLIDFHVRFSPDSLDYKNHLMNYRAVLEKNFNLRERC